MMKANYERAMVAANRNRAEEYELITKWFGRWQIALSIVYHEETPEEIETFDLIAPSAALNELPEEVVSRMWALNL